MLANYGYSDGSGDYFITIDTAKCDGCGDCVSACPAEVMQALDEDPNDPFNDKAVAVISQNKTKKIKYECARCKRMKDRPPLPCVSACKRGAIFHSW